MSDTLECEGEISQVNPSEILFEFSGPSGERSIGLVKIEDVKCYDKKGTLVCKSFNVGDKLKCSVVKASKDESHGDDEEFRHDWIATSAELHETGNVMAAESEDIIMLEDQQDNMFDYEEEDEDEEANDTKGQEQAGSTSTLEKSEKNAEQNDNSKVKPKQNCSIIQTQKAALLQLVEPYLGGKCCRALFSILTGEHQNTSVMIPSSRIRVWGHNLAKANLVYFLEYGDEATLDFSITTNNQKKDLYDKMIWFGPKDLDKPATAADNAEFAAWLKKKGIKESDFVNWVENKLPVKSFYPLISTLYSARVCGIAFDAANVGIGAFLTVGRIFKQASPQIYKDQSFPRDAIAFLPRESFYICGVPVANANLCFLLWPNDSILVQIRKPTRTEREKYAPLISQRPDLPVVAIAYVGNLGPERPKEAVGDPTKAKDLPKYLSKKNLSMVEFHKLRAGTYQPEIPQIMDGYFPFDATGSNVGNIEKINTDKGLVLTTKSSLKKSVDQQLAQANLMGFNAKSVGHQPSLQVEADFVKTNRLQSFQKPETEVSSKVAALRAAFICRDFQQKRCPRKGCRFLHCSVKEEEKFLKTGYVPTTHRDLFAQFVIRESKKLADSSPAITSKPTARRAVPENREQNPSKDVSPKRASELQVITKIVNRILDLESPDDSRVKILLQGQDEVEMAINMTAVLTKALMYTTQAMSKKPAVVDPLPGVANKRPNRHEDNAFDQSKRSRLMEKQEERKTSRDLDQFRPRSQALPDLRYPEEEDRARSKSRALPDLKYREEEDRARSKPQAALGSRYDPAPDESFRSRDQHLPGPRYEEPRMERATEAAYARAPTSAGPRYEEQMDRVRREVIPRYEDQVPTQRRDITPERYEQPEHLRKRIYQKESSTLSKQLYRDELETNSQYEDGLRFGLANPTQSRPVLLANPYESRTVLLANPTRPAQALNPFHSSEESSIGLHRRTGSSEVGYPGDENSRNHGRRQEEDYQPVYTGLRREEIYQPVNSALRREEVYPTANAGLRREEVYQPEMTGLRREEVYPTVNADVRREEVYQPVNTGLRHEEDYRAQELGRSRREEQPSYNVETRARPLAEYQTAPAIPRSLDYLDSNRFSSQRQDEIRSSASENAYLRPVADQYSSSRNEERFIGRAGDVMNPFAGEGFAGGAGKSQGDERYPEQRRERNYEDRNTTVEVGAGNNYQRSSDSANLYDYPSRVNAPNAETQRGDKMSKNLPYRQRPSITCWGDSHLMSHHHFAREFSVANSETGVAERYKLPEINATSGAKLDMAVVNKIITSMDENNFLQRPQVHIVALGGNNLRYTARKFQSPCSSDVQRREMFKEVEYLVTLVRKIAEASVKFQRTEVIICSIVPSPATQRSTEQYFIKLHHWLRSALAKYEHVRFCNFTNRCFVEKKRTIKRELFDSDGIHLNRQGVQQMAHKISLRLIQIARKDLEGSN